MSYDSVFAELKVLNDLGIETIHITDGVLTYLKNSPTYVSTLSAADDTYRRLEGHTLYVVPRCGDLLLDLTVSGTFEYAKMYQYDFIDRKVVYDELKTPGTMRPFEDGIPLVQCGKNVYLEVKEQCSYVTVSATYAFLDTLSRKTLCEYTYPDGNPYYINDTENSVYRHGVRIVHKSGDMYQVFNVTDHGFSPNHLGKCRDFGICPDIHTQYHKLTMK